MNSKQLVILTAVAAGLGGAVYYFSAKNDASWKTTGAVGAKVLDFKPDQVARVTIQGVAGAVNVAKKNDVWVVEERADYPAQFDRVSNLVRKLWDLKTVQDVKVGPSQFPKLELAEPLVGGAVRVEFKDGGGASLGAIIAGKKHMGKGGGGGMMGMGGDTEFPTGRYVTTAGGKTVSLVSDPLEDLDFKPESWLVKDFVKVEKVAAITLAGQTDAQKWKVSRATEADNWKLDGAKPEEAVDSGKAAPLATSLLSPFFADVLAPDAKPADTGLDKPTVITIETTEKFKYTFKVGKDTAGNQPVTVEIAADFVKERAPGKDEKPEDKTKLDEEFKTNLKRLEDKLAAEKKFEGRPFLIAKTTLDGIIKDRTALLAEKKPEAATPPAGAPPAAPGTEALPPGLVIPPAATPPGAPTPSASVPVPRREPVVATTPPVSVPPMKEAPAVPQPTTPGEAPKPADAPKAPETIKPAEPPKPADGPTPKPAKIAQPEPAKPAEALKAPEPPKPADAPKAPEPAKPADAPKAPEPKPAEPPKAQ